MSVIITMTVESDPTYCADAAAMEIVRLAERLGINVKTTWNGIEVTARPGMTAAAVIEDYDRAVRLSNYPED